MSKVHLVLPDSHAHPEYHNQRAEWVGRLIMDVKPDVMVNIGDQWDLPSLSSYDRGTKAFVGRTYLADIEAGLDFSEKLWRPIKKSKKKQPRKVFLEGNHEFRIKKAVNTQPELEGTVSFRDLDLATYDDVVEYDGNTPGVIEVDGILYAHYFVSGVMGRPIGGEHHASSLITKNLQSSVCGHSHTADWSVKPTAGGKQMHGLVAGVCQDYHSGWAGAVNSKWWRGVVILNDVSDGQFSPQFISLDMLRREYG